jgi:hypothetical protein
MMPLKGQKMNNLKEDNMNEKFTFQAFDKVIVRDEDMDIWHPALFSHYNPGSDFPYVVISPVYQKVDGKDTPAPCFKQCLPFDQYSGLASTTYGSLKEKYGVKGQDVDRKSTIRPCPCSCDTRVENEEIGSTLHDLAWSIKQGSGLDYCSSYSGVPEEIVKSIVGQLTKWIRDGKRYNSSPVGNRNGLPSDFVDGY